MIVKHFKVYNDKSMEYVDFSYALFPEDKLISELVLQDIAHTMDKPPIHGGYMLVRMKNRALDQVITKWEDIEVGELLILGTVVIDKTTVVHCKKDKFDIYIGRPSIWGNPFTIGLDGSREEVINKYRGYILGNKELLSKINSLKGKKLGCWCSPKTCHGDILAELANKE